MLDEPTHGALHAMIAPLTDGLPPPPWRFLGQGVWASVHDLGDGSVLKVVRRHGGLGSGESKLAREARTLELLDGLVTRHARVPRLIAHGSFASAYLGSGPALAGWLRIEKLSGRGLNEDGLYRLTAGQRETLGEGIGAAIADFHAATAALSKTAKFGDPILRSIDETLVRINSPAQREGLKRLQEMWRAEACEPVFLHGDINLSNALQIGGGSFGLIDFAEAGIGPLEADLKHFENAGSLRDAVFRSYAAVSGVRPDLRRYRMAVAVNAAASLAIEGESGHPREAMRRRAWLDEALRQAGIEA